MQPRTSNLKPRAAAHLWGCTPLGGARLRVAGVIHMLTLFWCVVAVYGLLAVSPWVYEQGKRDGICK